MRTRRTIRDLMEVQAEDINDIQAFVQQWGDDLVGDWLQPVSRRAFAGLSIVRRDAVTIGVGTGRLYAEKKQYGRDETGDVDLSLYLPAVAKRIVAIVVYGDTVDQNPDERDFAIDVDSDEVQPRPVDLDRARIARVSAIPGPEAPAPQPPIVDANYLVLAYVTMTTGGVANAAAINIQDDNRLANLTQAFEQIDNLLEKIRRQDQVVDGLRGDNARLKEALRNLPSKKNLLDVAADVARLKELAGVPDTRASYGADRFMDESESDKTRAGYNCVVSEGLRFAPANVSDKQLALQDPLDGSVEITGGGMILPRNVEKTVISIGDRKGERTGEIAMANYSTVGFPARALKLARARVRFGEDFRVSTASNWFDSGTYDPIAKTFTKDGEVFDVVDDLGLQRYARLRLKRYWEDLYNDDEYWLATSSVIAIAGKVVAQTYLNGAGRWIEAVRFYCTRKGAAGDVSVVISRCDNGKPDPEQVLAFATLPYADVVDGGWIRINIEPIFVRQGDRLALHCVTAGDHWFATADGDDYAKGTCFAYVDGDYADAMPDKTLCFELIQKEFIGTRTVVALENWTLDGGIASIDILAAMTFTSRNIQFEFKLGGKWRQIGDPKGQLTALATANPLSPLVEARVVMTHTDSIAPAIVLSGSRVRLSRPKTTLRHFSKVINFPSTTSIRTQHKVSDWDPALGHTFSVKLLTGAGYANTNVGSQSISIAGGGQKLITTVFTLGAAVTSAVIQEDGAAATPVELFTPDERVHVTF